MISKPTKLFDFSHQSTIAIGVYLLQHSKGQQSIMEGEISTTVRHQALTSAMAAINISVVSTIAFSLD